MLRVYIKRPSLRLLGRNPAGRLGLPERVPSAREYLVKIVLKPSDIWRQPCKLPLAVHLPVPVLVGAMRVALDCNLLATGVGVSLVRHTELVPTNDFVVRHLLPLGSTDEVLCLQQRIAQHVRIRRHLEELIRWHGLPHLVQERAVVDLLQK